MYGIQRVEFLDDVLVLCDGGVIPISAPSDIRGCTSWIAA